MATKEKNVSKGRRVMTLEKKLEVLNRLAAGETYSSVGRTLGVNESTIRSIKNSEMAIRRCLAEWSSGRSKVSYLSRDCVVQKVETSLISWMKREQRCLGDLLSSMVIRDKAKVIYAELVENVRGMSSDVDLKFQASKGWFENFRKRHELQYIKISRNKLTGDEPAGWCHSDFMKEDRVSASKGFKDSSEFGADFPLSGGQPSENEASQKVSSDEIYIKEEDFTSSNESFLLSQTPNPGIEEIDSLKMEVMDEEISDESFSLKPTSSGTSEQWSKSDEMNFAEAGLVMGTNYSSTEAPVPSVPHAPPVQVSTTFIRGGRIAQNSNPTSFPPVSSSTCNLLPKQNLPKQNLPKTNLPKNSLPIEELNEPGDYGTFVNSMVTEMDLKQQVLAKFYIFKILDMGKNGKLTPMGVTL